MITGNIDSFCANLVTKLRDTAFDIGVNQVGEVIKEELSKEIEYSYTEYTPWGFNCYERRYNKNGGFADPNMLKTQLVGYTGTGYVIKVINIAKGNGSQKNEYLSEIIEYGNSYTWSHGREVPRDEDVPPPRPVFERTLMTLYNSNIIQKSFATGFKNIKGVKATRIR